MIFPIPMIGLYVTHTALADHVDSTSLEDGEAILFASRRCYNRGGEAEGDAEDGGGLHGHSNKVWR